MLRVALPNKGNLAEPASTMMREAGYRQRTDPRELSTPDETNGVEFYYLRPKDIPAYVGKGRVNLGITGYDLMEESGSPVRQVLQLGFGHSKFRFAVPEDRDWTLEDLNGKKIATSYPRLVRAHLAGKRITLNKEDGLIKLDGAVEVSVELGLADAIADVVSSGRTLQQHHLKVIGDPIAESEATLIEVEARNDREDTLDIKSEKSVFIERLRGVVYARQYLMVDYDCPRSQLEAAKEITPGFGSPTVAQLARDNWVAVRAMVPVKEVNKAMDRLAKLGCTAILTSVIRSCRAVDGRPYSTH